MTILGKTAQLVHDKDFSIVNIDTIIFAESPKISPFRQAMLTNIAQAIGLDPDRINIKATTTEGLGPFGRGEGIGAMCVVLIQ